MAKDWDDHFNSGRPHGEDFSLEEILAEYQSRRERGMDDDTIPLPVIPQKDLPRSEYPRRTLESRNNVVDFPGKGGHRAAPEPPQREEEPEERLAPPEERQEGPTLPPPPRREDPAAPPLPSGEKRKTPLRWPGAPKAPGKREKVLSFPGEEPVGPEASPLQVGIYRLRRKADDYAEHMFEEEGVEDDEEVKRAEKYLPGVDQEDEDALLRRRRRRRRLPPAPDLPPAELHKRYHRGLAFLRFRSVLVLLLALPLLYLTLVPFFKLPLPGPLGESYAVQVYTLAGLLGAAMLLGVDVFLSGILRIFQMGMGMDTLVSFSCAATLADALTLLSLGGREGQMPYCAVSALALGLTMWGTYLKRQGSRGACRTAASAQEPYLVTLDEGKWNGRDAYAKWSGDSAGFGSQIQAPDGAQRVYRVTAPLLFIASVLFSVVASLGQKQPEHILWCLSATLAAAASFSAGLCFGMPWNALCHRLSKVGAAIAGWDGVTGTGGSTGILLTETDLFPPGSVSLNGIKVFGDFPVEKVVACAATLIRDSGSGLDKIFHDLLRSQGAIYRRCEQFEQYEGGLAAAIRGEQVLVGSAAFMHLMEVGLPQGLNVKNAVFCAIDGELAGIFALSYNLHGAVRPALAALIHNRVGPVLCTRDFNLIPAMLRQRFKLPVEKMEFPAVERRLELSDPDQEHGGVLAAVLCREGLGPFSEAVVGGRRLRAAVRWSAILSSVGSAVGVLLCFYLTFVSSYTSLSPANLLIFMLLWLLPTLFISGWVNKY